MADLIRIANAGGYWGDDPAQFHRQVELGRHAVWSSLDRHVALLGAFMR